MRWTTGLVMAMAMATTMATPAAAQGIVLNPGARVRLDAPSAGIKRFEGSVIATGDTIEVANGDARVRVPASAVTRLELSHGKNRTQGAVRGIMWGAGIGLVVGAVTVNAADNSTCYDSRFGRSDCTVSSKGEWIAASTVGGALWGALFGALIGRERWDTVALPGARATATVLPRIGPAGTVGLAVTLTR